MAAGRPPHRRAEDPLGDLSEVWLFLLTPDWPSGPLGTGDSATLVMPWLAPFWHFAVHCLVELNFGQGSLLHFSFPAGLPVHKPIYILHWRAKGLWIDTSYSAGSVQLCVLHIAHHLSELTLCCARWRAPGRRHISWQSAPAPWAWGRRCRQHRAPGGRAAGGRRRRSPAAGRASWALKSRV